MFGLRARSQSGTFFYGLGLMLVATALATIVYRIWETPGELVHDLVFSAIFATIASGIGLILDRAYAFFLAISWMMRGRGCTTNP
jgi:hypothetical protein